MARRNVVDEVLAWDVEDGERGALIRCRSCRGFGTSCISCQRKQIGLGTPEFVKEHPVRALVCGDCDGTGELHRPYGPPVFHEPATEDTIPSRAAVLREAEVLITGDRNVTYGPPTENFQVIADLWSTQFAHLLREGVRFARAHVAQAQTLVKLARMRAQPKRDNYVDGSGYLAIGWECQEADDAEAGAGS